jgi:hypothetical protein
MDDIVIANVKPDGMEAPEALAIKLQILLSPAPIKPAMAPPFKAFKNVSGFSADMISVLVFGYQLFS